MTQAHNGVDSQGWGADSQPGGVDPQDWVTIWQSEWAAMAVDREVQEGLITAANLWNTALAARADESPGRAGAYATPGTAPAGDASGASEPGPAIL